MELSRKTIDEIDDSYGSWQVSVDASRGEEVFEDIIDEIDKTENGLESLIKYLESSELFN